MKHDDRKAGGPGAVAGLVIRMGWMALLNVLKPAGLAGQSEIVGNRDRRAVRPHRRAAPTLNWARLATGSPGSPAWVKSEGDRQIPDRSDDRHSGGPDDLVVSSNPVSAWSVFDTAPAPGRWGRHCHRDRQRDLRAGLGGTDVSGQAILATHRGADYLIWNGRQSHRPGRPGADLQPRMDPRPSARRGCPTRLFDAMPATEPLVVPGRPGGRPSQSATRIGGRTCPADPRRRRGRSAGFYVLLPDGVQKVTAFVADLLRTANAGERPNRS